MDRLLNPTTTEVMASPLQLVGQDNTLQNYTEQNFNLANQALAGSLQQNQQLLASTQQTFANANAAIRQTIDERAQETSAQAQATAKNSGGVGGLLSGIASGLREYAEYDQKQQLQKYQIDLEKRKKDDEEYRETQVNLAKQKEADAKAQQEQQKQLSEQEYAEAFVQLNDYRSRFVGGDGFRQKGRLEFRDNGLDIIAGFKNLTPTQRKELTGMVYKDINEYTDSEVSTQHKKMDETQKAKSEYISAKFSLSMSGLFTRLKNPQEESAPIMQAISEREAAFLADKTLGLSETEKIVILTTHYKTYLGSVDTRNERHQEIQNKLTALETYGGYAAKVNQAVESGQISPTEGRTRLAMERERLGVPSTFTDPTPYEAEKLLETRLRTKKNIEEIQTAGVVNDAKINTLSNNAAGAMAWEFIRNPRLRQQIENDPAKSQIAADAIKLAKEYPQDIQAQQKIQLELNGLQQRVAEINVNAVEWFVRNSKDASVQEQLRNLGFNIPQQGLTVQQAQQYTGAIQALAQTYSKRAALLQEQSNTISAKYAPYGLNKPQGVLEKEFPGRLKAANQELEGLHQQALQSNQQRTERTLGIQSPFNQSQGTPARTFDSLMYVDAPTTNKFSGGKTPKVVLPFAPGTANITLGTRDYRDPNHGGHTHAGEDIAGAVGTPIVAYVGGTVVHAGWENPRNQRQGYGLYVTVKGDDGMFHRFAHLSGTNVKVGDRLQAGTAVGLLGNTGRSTGPHLHWEIRKGNTFGVGDTVDPIEYLTGLSINPSTAKKARGNTQGWDYSAGSISKEARIPQNAATMGKGLYMLNGVVGNRNKPGFTVTTQQAFNSQTPAKKGYTPNVAVPEQDPENTHGYAYLAKNADFRRAINQTANALGIPGSWLADIINVETSFDPKQLNSIHGRAGGKGYGGVIGFGEDFAREMGTTQAAILQLPPAQQMRYVYAYLNRPNIRPYLSRGVEYVAAAIFGGAGLMNKLIKNPARALGIGDGAINLRGYVQRLGKSVGRRYQLKTDRQSSLLQPVHDSYTTGCAFCQEMQQANSFATHLGEYT